MNCRLISTAAILIVAWVLAEVAQAQTISGVITAGGLPDIGATVTATAGTQSFSTTTSATGAFNLAVAVGVYTVDVEPSGVGTVVYAPVRLESRHVVTTLNVGTLALPLGYTLTGSVFYQGGLPVPNGDTDVLNAVSGEKLFTPGDNTSLTGIYAVVVPIGSYRIVADAAAGNYVSQESAIVTVTGGLPSVSVPPLTLPLGFLLTATIRDSATNLGIANVDIDVENAATNTRLQTPTDKTDATGLVSVVVPAGTWRVNVDPAPGDPHLGMQILNVPVFGNTNFGNVLIPSGVLIQGYVKGGGVGIIDASVDVDTTLGPVRRYTPNDKTAHDGFFIIAVPLGSYRFLATPPATTAFAPVQSAAITVNGNMTLPDLLAPPGATLSGVVTSPFGQPETGFSVSLNDPTTNAPVTSTSTSTSAPGSYARRVPLGTNLVTYRPSHYSRGAPFVVPIAVNGATTWNVQLPSATLLNFIAPGIHPTTIPHGGVVTFDAALFNNTFINQAANLSVTLLDPSGSPIPMIAPFPVVLTGGQLILAPNIALPLPPINPAHYGYPFKLRFLLTTTLSGVEIDRDDIVLTIT